MERLAQLSHVDEKGQARMVDVTLKPATMREAVARGRVWMHPETLALIAEGTIAKGDVLATARLAGIMAAKQVGSLIPLCHPLNLTSVTVEFDFNHDDSTVEIEAVTRVNGPTGVEMEALTAVSVAGLTIYDMCKAVDRGMVIGDIRLVKKSGGKSGTYIRLGENYSIEEKE